MRIIGGTNHLLVHLLSCGWFLRDYSDAWKYFAEKWQHKQTLKLRVDFTNEYIN